MADSFLRPANVVTTAEFRVMIASFGALRSCSVGTSRTFTFAAGQKLLLASNDSDRMMSVLVKPVPGGVGNIPLRMSPTDSSFQNVNSIDKLVDFDLNTTLVLKPSQQLWAQSPAAAVVSVTQVFV